MSKPDSPATERFRNSTCKHLGHEWTLTAAQDWRWCRRENCPASERLVNGQWVSNAPLYRKHQPVVPPARRPRQAALWENEHEPKETSRS